MAFDTVLHRYILQATVGIGLGVKLQAFFRSFLVNGTATTQVGRIQSSVYELGARGTPQGSVISPLLFNIVMKGLSDKLGGLPGIGHALYADDITIWCPGGSLAEMEQALQAALHETDAYLADTGLKLSPSKSEQLLYRPARQGVRGLTPFKQLPVVLYANNGQIIPRVDSVKILGLIIDARGCNARTMTHVTAKTENMLRLIARVSNRF